MSRQIHLQDAMNKLNIDDALALLNAFSGDDVVAECHQTRTNPITYLSKTFKHAVTLLSVMFDTGCVISGSRALDFFVPGSVAVDSDWDFYVPGYKESVADMINILSLCGVAWESGANSMANTLSRDGRVEVNRSILENLSSWVYLDRDGGVFDETVREILTTYLGLRGRMSWAKSYTISRQPSGILTFQPNVDKRCYAGQETNYATISGEQFGMLKGSIHTPQGVQPVQLIVGCSFGAIRSSLSFIKGFYASHVQCFIGGWCAAHMYYYHARSKETTVWERKHNTRAIDKAIQKYTDRGFLFQNSTHTGPSIRRFCDDNAMFLDYGDIYRPFLRKSNFAMFDQWMAERRQNLETIYWVEFRSRIDVLSSPLERYSRGQASFADARYRLPLCRLRRLSDIIALSTTVTGGMRTKEFFSSVRMTIEGTTWDVEHAARSGGVYNHLQDANPWSWAM